MSNYALVKLRGSRLYLRKDIRESLSNLFVITADPADRCLLAFSLDYWSKVEQQLMRLPNTDRNTRTFQRMLFGYASEITINNDGTVTLPPPLLAFSGISKQALFLKKRNNSYELWNPNIYLETLEELTSDALNLMTIAKEIYPKAKENRIYTDSDSLKERVRSFLVTQGMQLESLEDHIFISYSSKDRSYVERLATDLRKIGTNIWIDYVELLPGDSLIDNIQKAIKKSGWFMVVLSKNSINSEWCKKELNQALNEEISRKNVFVIPVVIDDVTLPGFLLDKVYADLRPTYYEQNFTLLRRRFAGSMGSD